jgi:hypothetical protein
MTNRNHLEAMDRLLTIKLASAAVAASSALGCSAGGGGNQAEVAAEENVMDAGNWVSPCIEEGATVTNSETGVAYNYTSEGC